MALKEYKPGSAFNGVIGRTFDVVAGVAGTAARQEGAPNVLFIVQDDTGFAQMGCYGGPIATPNIDALATNGLLFNNMHTTALCSPSRSCVLTGPQPPFQRDGLHHRRLRQDIPGSNGNIPFENGMLSEMLLQHGYNTYALGKWHLTPADQISAAGPYDRWPLGRGFERYYGFLGGDTHQYYPDLVYDNHTIEAPKTPEEGYHLTPTSSTRRSGSSPTRNRSRRTSRSSCTSVRARCTLRTTCPRSGPTNTRALSTTAGTPIASEPSPSRKSSAIIPKDAELSRHDPDVAQWSSLSADEKKLYARMMEVFAGFLEHTDYHYGRLFDFLKSIGELDNTLIMFISDNGASSEGGPHGSVNENKFFNNVPEYGRGGLKMIDELGGPKTFNHYPWGWTFAGNTPFRRWKRETYRGGVSDPFIVHWPKGIKAKGELRTQYAHAIDMVPTVLELLGIDPPQEISGVTQSPIQGLSFASALDDAKAPSQHHTQYFEMFGHRSLYHDGWRAVCPWPGTSFAEAGLPFGAPIDADEAHRTRREGLGAVPHRGGLRREPQRRSARTAQADRDDRHAGTSRPASTTCCRSTAAERSGSPTSAPSSR